MPSETPKPPDVYENWLDAVLIATREHEGGWQYAKYELAELREQVKQAANLLAVANDPDPLANRLRGIYQLEDGSSRSVARFVPPIQVVAAAEIDRLRNEVTQARNAALEEAMAVAAPYAAAHPIGMAILEKIESLKGS